MLPGAVDVVVTNLDGQSGSLANGFTFVAAPTVTAITPVVGPAAGGTAVTLTGTGFTDRRDGDDRRRRGDECDRGERDLDHGRHAPRMRPGPSTWS